MNAVAWLLKVKGVSYELVPTAPPAVGVTPEFLKMNPNGFVPVLKDGDFSLFEGYVCYASLWLCCYTYTWPELCCGL